MPKLTKEERIIVKSLVVTLSLRRLPENEIIKEIEKHTNKSFSRISLYYIKQEIKKDSYEWYMKLRSNQYEYLHEFKERINEILWLQQKHQEIIGNDREPIQQ